MFNLRNIFGHKKHQYIATLVRVDPCAPCELFIWHGLERSYTIAMCIMHDFNFHSAIIESMEHSIYKASIYRG